ncbi:hypothetical protein VTO73DRAFT_9643 [Trametes versicolor]
MSNGRSPKVNICLSFLPPPLGLLSSLAAILDAHSGPS